MTLTTNKVNPAIGHVKSFSAEFHRNFRIEGKTGRRKEKACNSVKGKRLRPDRSVERSATKRRRRGGELPRPGARQAVRKADRSVLPSLVKYADATMEEGFLTTEEVLDYLQVNLRTVYRLIKAGKIPAVRVGRQWRFRKRDIDAWLE